MLFQLLLLSLLAAFTSAQSCLDCICKVESGCRAVGCEWDVGSYSCGPFQIKLPYYKDCGAPGRRYYEPITTAWVRCANDYSCARGCVEAYYRRFAKGCWASGCQAMARLHNGGPAGCRNPATLRYWNKVYQC